VEPFKIFVGYDPVETVSYHTMCHSILSRSTIPVSFTPINQRNLKRCYDRPRDPKQSNEFSFTRFLVPYLCGYQGWAAFFDCDMMVRTDIKELYDLRDENKALLCVQHDYTPKLENKYLGNVQYQYPRKNWSSVVLWNCGHPANRILTPKYVEQATGLELHRFNHLTDSQIGSLDVGWNWLVQDYNLSSLEGGKKRIKNVHWTNFGPWLNDYQHVDFADEWYIERGLMNYALQNDRREKTAEKSAIIVKK
jgi:hypothetical protein